VTVAFVGTSRVIRRYRHYPPGSYPDRSAMCLRAVDICSGEVLGSLLWPNGNQIFAVEGIDRHLTQGIPFNRPDSPGRKPQAALFSRGVAA